MRVALMVEGQEGVSWDQWVALAEACEQHGVEALFRSDHYLSLTAPDERVATDAWSLLGALAARTTTLRLGTLVSPVTFRHPAVVAKAVATVDHVSGGRVEVGMGAGWMEAEHERFGFPFPPMSERLELLAEHVEHVDRQLREDPLTVQRPRPPLILGEAPSAAPPCPRLVSRTSTTRTASTRRRRHAGGRGWTGSASRRAATPPRFRSR
jgi:alkanesulfonate monooxygenase SsuD/methylene tetrahydromethanopterin reductase-like flavin-dependent oxidoreductase (luciferase family)